MDEGLFCPILRFPSTIFIYGIYIAGSSYSDKEIVDTVLQGRLKQTLYETHFRFRNVVFSFYFLDLTFVNFSI